MALELYNSLTKQKEIFKPRSDKAVGLYTCGPTVYDFVHIGNWRSYTLGDLIYRVLRYNNYEVNYIMNITDVGHLVSDADEGEDKLEKGARREGKNAWHVAEYYTDDFLRSYEFLHLTKPEVFSKATDHIEEQIDLVSKLLEKNFAYQITDGIYFNTEEYEKAGFTYGELSNLDQIREGARVEINHEKKNPRDFSLWKFSPKGEKRDMEWESPWGVGFPGWHIECSAMAMKYLGEQFDIHVGGEDLKSTHHPNEIAQSQGATGKSPFVAYWVHGSFLQIDGGKMGKSLGNAYTIHDVIERKHNPIALRYFYFTAHYRSSLNFTWESLTSAQNALEKAFRAFQDLPKEEGTIHPDYKKRFLDAINDDLNMPIALSVMWELLKDETLSPRDKKSTLLDFDKVFGFGFADLVKEETPPYVLDLIKERDGARENKDWKTSDEIRKRLEALGYEVNDTPEGTKLHLL